MTDVRYQAMVRAAVRAPTHMMICGRCGLFLWPCECTHSTIHHADADLYCKPCARIVTLGRAAFDAMFDTANPRDRTRWWNAGGYETTYTRIALAVDAAAKEMDANADG